MIFLAYLVASIASFTCAQKFEIAANLYKQGQFEQAYAILHAVDPKSSTVWYNMGNCAYKNNELYRARTCWLCAEVRAVGDVRQYTEYNLHVVEKKLNIDRKETFFKKIQNFYRSIDLMIIQIIFLIFWFSLLFFIKKYKHGTKYRSLFLGLLLFLVILGSAGLGLKYHSINQRRGIIMKQHVSLFAGPDEQFHILGSLEGGSEVIVHEQRPSWFKISTDQISGWVMQDSIVVP
jgi:hypothetical protein